ncbi:hypothetical protein ACVWZ4_003789 [Bradyrhizobium sp. USDA 4472]
MVTSSSQLETAHSRAICHEIGERLRLALNKDQSPLPSHLRATLDRLAEMDARAYLRSISSLKSKACE